MCKTCCAVILLVFCNITARKNTVFTPLTPELLPQLIGLRQYIPSVWMHCHPVIFETKRMWLDLFFCIMTPGHYPLTPDTHPQKPIWSQCYKATYWSSVWMIALKLSQPKKAQCSICNYRIVKFLNQMFV